MNKKMLLIGTSLLAFMAIATWLAEGCFAGARPYAAASTLLMFFALATR